MSEVFTEKVAFKRKQKSLQGKVEIGHAANEEKSFGTLKLCGVMQGQWAGGGRGWLSSEGQGVHLQCRQEKTMICLQQIS